MLRNPTCALAFLALMAGCNLTTRSYDGAPRPQTEVAIVRTGGWGMILADTLFHSEDELCIRAVDGVTLRLPQPCSYEGQLEVLPGTRLLEVAYRRWETEDDDEVVPTQLVSKCSCEMEARLEAGGRYRLRDEVVTHGLERVLAVRMILERNRREEIASCSCPAKF